MVIFIENPDSDSDPGGQVITDCLIPPLFGAEGQKQKSGQNSIKRNVKEAVRIEFIDAGNNGRVGEEEDAEDVSGGKGGE